MAMLSLLFPVPAPSTFVAVLAFFILDTSGVLALSSLTSEPHRRSPVLAIMAAFSPLAITGYSFLAIGLSYTLLRLFLILKPRLLSSAATTAALPQPVSAGRTSAFSFRSPFASFRHRQKSTAFKPARTRSRWSPLSAFYRRLTRPSSPLHLSETDGLPITMPDSTSATRTLLELPVISGSSPLPLAKNHSHIFQARQISRSSSMDTLPSYRPLTPVLVHTPVVSRTASSPPTTPSPSTPKFLPGVEDEDIPLIPITPQKRRPIPQMPATTRDVCALPTPPHTGSFPAISLSPFKPNNSTFVQSGYAVEGTRPSPSIFLASRSLSSLSLSPRSQALQQSKRNKGLGGVPVKRISPPQSYFDQESESEPTQDVTNSLANTGKMTIEPEGEVPKISAQLVSLVASPPKFLLNFSSPPSSPASDSSSLLGLLSLSPSTSSNSDTPPTSVPLATSRATSQSSNSTDIAKPLEDNPFLPRPIPLVDVDTDVYTISNEIPGFEMNWKAPGWSFDAEELGSIELSFDSPSTGENSSSPTKHTTDEVEKELIEIEHENDKLSVDQQRVEETGWEWDADPEEQESCAAEAHDGCDAVQNVQDDEAMSKDRGAIDRVELSTDCEAEEDIRYPDPDLLPLPETINVLPSILTEADSLPVISICTQPAGLCRSNSNGSSGVSSASSQSGQASPISLVQTPTPPASPPREARIASLLKPTIADDLDDDRWTATSISPVSENFGPMDVELIKDRFRAPSIPLVTAHVNSLPTDETHASTTVDHGVGEDNSRFFDDQRFFSSPEYTTQELPTDSHDGIEDEYTLNVECASDDDAEDDSHHCDKTDIVIPLPYGSGDGPNESAKGEEEMPPCTEGRLKISEAKVFGGRAGTEEAVIETLEETQEPAVVDVANILPQLQMDAHPADKVQSDAPVIPQEELAPSSAPTPVSEQPHTSLPGTFHDAKPSLGTDPIPGPQTSPNSSVPSQSQRRRRSPLEEAIARTRSPLEVALAMQLRPGLGLGADPAWMVRFMMVMWGWMFGMVLVPGVEA